MLKRFSVNYALFSMAVDALLTLVALAITEALAPAWLHLIWPGKWIVPPERIMPRTQWPVVVLLWQLVFLLTSAYDPKRTYKAVDEFQNTIVAMVLAGVGLAGMLYLANREVSRWLYVLFLILNVTLLLGWRVIARLAFQLLTGRVRQRRVLVVGAGEVGRRVAQMVQAHSWIGLEMVGYLDDDPLKQPGGLPVYGTLDDAPRVIQDQGIEEVVIALPRRAWERLNQLVVTLHEFPVHVHIIPDYFALALWRAEGEDFAGIPMIDLRAPALNEYQRLVKRWLDLTAGAVLTLLALPIMALVALAVRLDSPGPVIFRQRRVGGNGKLFWMYKLRSMEIDAEAHEQEILRLGEEDAMISKRRGDPRITAVGRFIRRTSLDELPQLINVLKGDMSLVGPRPELPWLVDLYEPWQRKRFAVPQGITGWWQINGRSDREMHRHTDDDLYYVRHYSFWFDLMILAKTVLVVVRGRGAY